MKVNVEVTMKDCRDCPFKSEYRGHGECWAECTRKVDGMAWHEKILWGCQEEFKAVPVWCPLGLGKE